MESPPVFLYDTPLMVQCIFLKPLKVPNIWQHDKVVLTCALSNFYQGWAHLKAPHMDWII